MKTSITHHSRCTKVGPAHTRSERHPASQTGKQESCASMSRPCLMDALSDACKAQGMGLNLTGKGAEFEAQEPCTEPKSGCTTMLRFKLPGPPLQHLPLTLGVVVLSARKPSGGQPGRARVAASWRVTSRLWRRSSAPRSGRGTRRFLRGGGVSRAR